jgi:hypothetical protein
MQCLEKQGQYAVLACPGIQCLLCFFSNAKLYFSSFKIGFFICSSHCLGGIGKACNLNFIELCHRQKNAWWNQFTKSFCDCCAWQFFLGPKISTKILNKLEESAWPSAGVPSCQSVVQITARKEKNVC